jgi:hypothetical protein
MNRQTNVQTRSEKKRTASAEERPGKKQKVEQPARRTQTMTFPVLLESPIRAVHPFTVNLPVLPTIDRSVVLHHYPSTHPLIIHTKEYIKAASVMEEFLEKLRRSTISVEAERWKRRAMAHDEMIGRALEQQLDDKRSYIYKSVVDVLPMDLSRTLPPIKAKMAGRRVHFKDELLAPTKSLKVPFKEIISLDAFSALVDTRRDEREAIHYVRHFSRRAFSAYVYQSHWHALQEREPLNPRVGQTGQFEWSLVLDKNGMATFDGASPCVSQPPIPDPILQEDLEEFIVDSPLHRAMQMELLYLATAVSA